MFSGNAQDLQVLVRSRSGRPSRYAAEHRIGSALTVAALSRSATCGTPRTSWDRAERPARVVASGDCQISEPTRSNASNTGPRKDLLPPDSRDRPRSLRGLLRGDLRLEHQAARRRGGRVP